MTNNFDTSFIRDITPDPAWVDHMLETIDKAIDDSLTDYAFTIATDYCPAPPEEGYDEWEDAMMDQVVNPIQDRLTNFIIAKWITGPTT